jgi:proline iminopeptidase
MVYLDQRGSGHSERPASRDYALTTLVDDVEGLRRALGVEQVALIGHSFGGVLALEYAARYPERVSRLVLASTPASLPTACAARKARLLEQHTELRAKADSLVRAGSGDCEVEFRLLRGPDREAFGATMMFPDSILRRRQDSIDASSGLRNTGEVSASLIRNGLLSYRFTAPDRLTMPVLVIAGGLDYSVGIPAQRMLAESVRTATFVRYDRAGHFVYLDEPDRFSRDVIAFLAK